jgi:acylphosphatase
MTSITENVRAHVRLSGRVQGVGFRYATADEARQRRLGGWVRNLGSSGVEAVFEGPLESVQAMLHWCQQGPPGASVRDLNVVWDEPLEHLRQFDIRPTALD